MWMYKYGLFYVALFIKKRSTRNEKGTCLEFLKIQLPLIHCPLQQVYLETFQSILPFTFCEAESSMVTLPLHG